MTKFKAISLVVFFLLNSLDGTAKNSYSDFIKIGNKATGRFSLPSAFESVTDSEEDYMVTKETNKNSKNGTGSVIFVFQKLSSLVVGGAGGEFDFTTGSDLQDEKVNINFVFTQRKTNKSIVLSTDDESSVVAGSIKVKPAFGCEGYIATYALQVSNILKYITRFDGPDSEDTRITKTIKGRIVRSSPNGGCASLGRVFSQEV